MRGSDEDDDARANDVSGERLRLGFGAWLVGNEEDQSNKDNVVRGLRDDVYAPGCCGCRDFYDPYGVFEDGEDGEDSEDSEDAAVAGDQMPALSVPACCLLFPRSMKKKEQDPQIRSTGF